MPYGYSYFLSSFLVYFHWRKWRWRLPVGRLGLMAEEGDKGLLRRLPLIEHQSLAGRDPDGHHSGSIAHGYLRRVSIVRLN